MSEISKVQNNEFYKKWKEQEERFDNLDKKSREQEERVNDSEKKDREQEERVNVFEKRSKEEEEIFIEEEKERRDSEFIDKMYIVKELNDIVERNRKYAQFGQVASYIPELKHAIKSDLGVCIVDREQNIYCAGEYDKKFTIQSISKTVLLAMALMEYGYDFVKTQVGFEPSDNPFNSIVSIGSNNATKPSNPMLNSGAIVITSLVKGRNLEEKEKSMLDYFRKFANNDSLKINYDVYESEKKTGERNRAMAHLLKSNGFIDGDVEEILDLYFRQCSIEVTSKDLAMMGLNFATQGHLFAKLNGFKDHEYIITKDVAKIVKAVMLTCGMYDGS
ncbi:MAG: glutaminase A, partial [Clostridioides sp.]|nr:glutaminase A [Clostridioides sp.]